jgi:hypothetical protein
MCPNELRKLAQTSSFFGKPSLAQAIDDHWWDWGPGLQEPFDGELRIETTRLRQSEFRLGVVPRRSLSSRPNAPAH